MFLKSADNSGFYREKVDTSQNKILKNDEHPCSSFWVQVAPALDERQNVKSLFKTNI